VAQSLVYEGSHTIRDIWNFSTDSYKSVELVFPGALLRYRNGYTALVQSLRRPPRPGPTEDHSFLQGDFDGQRYITNLTFPDSAKLYKVLKLSQN
jgi:hypothetical protein